MESHLTTCQDAKQSLYEVLNSDKTDEKEPESEGKDKAYKPIFLDWDLKGILSNEPTGWNCEKRATYSFNNIGKGLTDEIIDEFVLRNRLHPILWKSLSKPDRKLLREIRKEVKLNLKAET